MSTSEAARRELAGQMVRELPRFGRWAVTIRDYETPYGKVGYRQLATLWLIRFHLVPGDDFTPSQLAEHLEVQPSVVTRLLAKLEANGFIERSVDPTDGRSYHVQITEKGLHVSEFVEELYMQELLASIAWLDDAQIAELRRSVNILTGVVARLEANRKQRS
jgi:DNA-binding MarR family transcriptional regulator